MNEEGNSSSSSSRAKERQLFALIGEDQLNMRPYRSKFQIKSIGSGSRASRDSDLLNRLCADQSKSSKSLSRNVSNSHINHHSLMGSSNQNSIVSDGSEGGRRGRPMLVEIKQPPKIHNCVCFVAGECLSYNCNCFLSPFPCTPQCCSNCITLKSQLPLKVSNICSCKKTRCLKLYCECLSKGQFCSVMCQCQFCENHEHSASREQSLQNLTLFRGCSCQKSRCQKKYCECFAQGLKCTRKCGCIDCKNFIQDYRMDEEQPIKKQQIQDNSAMDDQLQFQQIDFFTGKRLG